MGRTLSPFSQLIEQERRTWGPFKRALRKEDQATFDRLFDYAKLHVQAGVYLSRPWPFEVIAMAILLEQQKRLEQVLKWCEAFGHGIPALTGPDPQGQPTPPTLLDGLTPPLPGSSTPPRDAQP
jgi:hypothetical protein